MVKNVFLVLMYTVMAVILYLVFFGTKSLNGNDLVGVQIGTITQTQSWKGLIWFMAGAVENSTARYYYEYCFLPNIHNDDYVDEALGGQPSSSYFESGDLQKTETNLSSASSDLYNFPAENSGIRHYSTGWK